MSQILYLLDLRSLRNRARTGVRQVRCLGEKCNEELTFNIIQVQVWSLQRAETSPRQVDGCVGLRPQREMGRQWAPRIQPKRSF